MKIMKDMKGQASHHFMFFMRFMVQNP